MVGRKFDPFSALEQQRIDLVKVHQRVEALVAEEFDGFTEKRHGGSHKNRATVTDRLHRVQRYKFSNLCRFGMIAAAGGNGWRESWLR